MIRVTTLTCCASLISAAQQECARARLNNAAFILTLPAAAVKSRISQHATALVQDIVAARIRARSDAAAERLRLAREIFATRLAGRTPGHASDALTASEQNAAFQLLAGKVPRILSAVQLWLVPDVCQLWQRHLLHRNETPVLLLARIAVICLHSACDCARQKIACAHALLCRCLRHH